MKKILFIELSSGFGGSSDALFNVLKYLNKDKYEPVLLIARRGKNFERIGSLGVKTHIVPWLYLKHHDGEGQIVARLKAVLNLILDIFPNSFRFWQVIHGEKIDLVYINTNIKNNLQAILAARWAGVPCIAHVRETRKLLSMEAKYRSMLSRIVVLNPQAYAIMAEGYEANQVVLIPDGLDFDIDIRQESLPLIREQFGLTGQRCVGILGRLIDGKGQDDFIKAAALVLKEIKDVKFLIVGNDPDQNASFEHKLRALAKELGIEKQVVFCGWRTDKYEMISVLDILVQASSTFPEGFGLTIIEAMSLSKPVVATDIPGPNSIIKDGHTGLLVAPSQPDQLAAAILSILKDPKLALSLGQAGQSQVFRNYDIRTTVVKIEDMLQKVLC